jgi:hypothetical protein
MDQQPGGKDIMAERLNLSSPVNLVYGAADREVAYRQECTRLGNTYVEFSEIGRSFGGLSNMDIMQSCLTRKMSPAEYSTLLAVISPEYRNFDVMDLSPEVVKEVDSVLSTDVINSQENARLLYNLTQNIIEKYKFHYSGNELIRLYGIYKAKSFAKSENKELGEIARQLTEDMKDGKKPSEKYWKRIEDERRRLVAEKFQSETLDIKEKNGQAHQEQAQVAADVSGEIPDAVAMARAEAAKMPAEAIRIFAGNQGLELTPDQLQELSELSFAQINSRITDLLEQRAKKELERYRKLAESGLKDV